MTHQRSATMTILVKALITLPAVVFLCCRGNPNGPDREGPEPGVSVTVLTPNGGESFAPGDTVHVSWRADTTAVNDVMIWLQLDEGVREIALTTEASITVTSPQWGNFTWVVPPGGVEGGKSVISDKATIWIHKYNDTRFGDYSDEYFVVDGKEH